MPKRIGGIHQRICTEENVELADKKARKNKRNKYGIKKHDENHEIENYLLQMDLANLTYKTSDYSKFIIHEPKEREIYRLPYYPDRIAHHAIMNILESVWTKTFIKNTYSCIKGRGIHKLLKDLKSDLTKYPEKTVYCLKLDIKKFYPSIDHEILKNIIRRKLKDKYALRLLDEIIDSAPGVPIGNYLSQYFANLYLTYFDHWVKEELKCKFYYRYADDIVILSDNKDFLHNVLCAIKLYLSQELKLTVKPNYQVFPVESRGIDFVGYVFYHKYIKLRKSIKANLMNLVNKYDKGLMSQSKFERRISSYRGWLKWCNAKHLAQIIQDKTNVRISTWDGERVPISKFRNKRVHIVEIISRDKYFEIHCIYRKKPYSIRSRDSLLFLQTINYKNIVL